MMTLAGLLTGVALALAATFASSQTTSGTAAAGAASSAAISAQTNHGTPSQLPAGKPSNDSNTMGIAGPESPADTAAPNVASCQTVKSDQERSKCMALAQKVPKKSGKSPQPAGSGPAS
jgi:hypothetical protein